MNKAMGSFKRKNDSPSVINAKFIDFNNKKMVLF